MKQLHAVFIGFLLLSASTYAEAASAPFSHSARVEDQPAPADRVAPVRLPTMALAERIQIQNERRAHLVYLASIGVVSIAMLWYGLTALNNFMATVGIRH
jgi:hypothetical protein